MNTTQPLPGPISLFASAWTLFKAHWKILAGIAAVSSVPLYLGQALGASHLSGIWKLVGVLLTIGGAVLSIALQPALTLAVQSISKEPAAPLTVKGQYSVGFRYFWPLAGLAIIHGLMILGGVVLFIVPGIIIGVYSALYTFSRILDEKKGMMSFMESYALVRGRWWPVLGRLLFVVVIGIFLSLISAGILFLVRMAIGAGAASSEASAVAGILKLALNIVLIPLLLTYLYNLYVSLKGTVVPAAEGATDTAAFRKWLIFFLVVGILVLILIPIIGLGVAAAISAAPHP
ncbi:MAG: hypothetical protein JWO00_516 [Candidatus Parcubacteria bacterium]|nr:hypothetical protein [Candidatus Parcubacteria bacterium]